MRGFLSKLSCSRSASPTREALAAGTPQRSRPSSIISNATYSSGADAGVRSSRGAHVAEPPMGDGGRQTINVILFGEAGVGKSAVVNLIAQNNVAPVSADVRGCTMESKPYHVSFDGINFCIFDTVGLNQPEFILDPSDSTANSHLQAIERAYKLILDLRKAGGIHLLLFCMRRGKITMTTRNNYRLFVEFLCQTRVPVGVVVTNCEHEKEMEDWWVRNATNIEKVYGIKSDGHACVTTVTDGSRSEESKYKESQRRVRELVKSCSLTNGAFTLDAVAWLATMGNGIKNLIKEGKAPERKDMEKLLVKRLGLSQQNAKMILDVMGKGDTG